MYYYAHKRSRTVSGKSYIIVARLFNSSPDAKAGFFVSVS